MEETVYEQIQDAANILDIDFSAQEMAKLATDLSMDGKDLKAIAETFDYLRKKHSAAIVSALLRMSRLPLKEPKTFQNFDFTQLHGSQAELLRTLPELSALYARRNLAFIGPQGVGKTHLAMAYGRACCEKGMKTYFLKANELNQKFTDARKYGRETSTMNGLVKPSCLIIDEVGRCVFDRENTRMFFDVIDRRYNKDSPNTTIFTSNKGPDKWQEFFNEDSSLLCALDRIFDNATVYLIKGKSYRGRRLEKVTLTAGTTVGISKISD